MQLDSTQAEPILCATLVARPDLLDDIILSHDDFHDKTLGLVFRTIQWLWEHGKPVSSVVIIDKLAKRREIDRDVLVQACDETIAQPWAAAELARIVRDSAARRRMAAAAYRMLEIAQTAEEIDDNAMAEVEKAIAEIGATVEADAGPILLADLLEQYWTDFEERVMNRDKLIGVDTGFAKLNKWLQGWRPGYLCVVGARPGMGKTAFMLQSASRGAKEDIAVLFSIEMLRDVLIDRMMSAQSMVPLFKVMNGHIDDEHRLLLTKALAELEERKVYIDDNPYATVPYIRAKLRKIARQNSGKKLVVFVDYLQIVKTEKGRSRAEEIGQVSSQLKAIAKELNCCIVALAQVNRQVDSRADKRPVLSDIRDSGQIEQDADVIMFLYRDEYYNPDTPTKGVIEIIVAKNRNGSTGTTRIGFSKEYQLFIDFPEEGDK